MAIPKATNLEPYVLKSKTREVTIGGKKSPVYTRVSKNVFNGMSKAMRSEWVVHTGPGKAAPKKAAVKAPPEVKAKQKAIKSK